MNSCVPILALNNDAPNNNSMAWELVFRNANVVTLHFVTQVLTLLLLLGATLFNASIGTVVHLWTVCSISYSRYSFVSLPITTTVECTVCVYVKNIFAFLLRSCPWSFSRCMFAFNFVYVTILLASLVCLYALLILLLYCCVHPIYIWANEWWRRRRRRM